MSTSLPVSTLAAAAVAAGAVAGGAAVVVEPAAKKPRIDSVIGLVNTLRGDPEGDPRKLLTKTRWLELGNSSTVTGVELRDVVPLLVTLGISITHAETINGVIDRAVTVLRSVEEVAALALPEALSKSLAPSVRRMQVPTLARIVLGGVPESNVDEGGETVPQRGLAAAQEEECSSSDDEDEDDASAADDDGAVCGILIGPLTHHPLVTPAFVQANLVTKGVGGIKFPALIANDLFARAKGALIAIVRNVKREVERKDLLVLAAVMAVKGGHGGKCPRIAGMYATAAAFVDEGGVAQLDVLVLQVVHAIWHTRLGTEDENHRRGLAAAIAAMPAGRTVGVHVLLKDERIALTIAVRVAKPHKANSKNAAVPRTHPSKFKMVQFSLFFNLDRSTEGKSFGDLVRTCVARKKEEYGNVHAAASGGASSDTSGDATIGRTRTALRGSSDAMSLALLG